MKRLYLNLHVLCSILVFSFTSADLNAATGSPSFYPALKADGYSLPAIHSRDKIMASIRSFENLQAGSPYSTDPVLKYPYNQGVLNNQFLNHGLAAVNFYRFLSGLPDDVKLDDEWNITAQHGSALLGIINRGLSHTPAYPSGINLSRDFYNRGYAGTSTSNLHSGQGNLAQAVGGFIYDSDRSNIDRLGHRRWVLNPEMTVTGFGFTAGYAAMKVFGDTAAPARKDIFAYAAWPAAGEMPLSYFPGTSAWSFSLNPSAFGGVKGDKRSVTVTVKRIGDGKIWSFGGTTTNQNGYFNIETSGFGMSYCIIFRPDNIGIINDGDVFEVNISGVTNGKGNPIPIQYRTGFFNTGKKIETSAVSKHPRSVVMNYSWSTSRYGKRDGVENGPQMTFGFTGVPVEGFSLIADSPGGIIPLGFSVNKSDKIYGPGEWVSGNGNAITSLKLLTSAGGYNITFTVYCKAKGWSSWGNTGDELGFGPSYPIESIAIRIENE